MQGTAHSLWVEEEPAGQEVSGDGGEEGGAKEGPPENTSQMDG